MYTYTAFTQKNPSLLYAYNFQLNIKSTAGVAELETIGHRQKLISSFPDKLNVGDDISRQRLS